MIANNKPYIKAIDALRVISILGVILIHTTTKVLETSHYNLFSYPFTLFLNQLVRFAVPLFFMISGFVLELNYNYHASYYSYLKRRVAKVLIPYTFWSLIYYYFVYTQNQDSLVRVILTGSASYQLYFIPTLCIFYLIFPFLHKIYKFLANGFTLFLLGITQIWLMDRDYFVKQFAVPDPIRILLLAYFIFIVGMVAARNKDKLLQIVARIKYILIITGAYMVYYIFEEGITRYFKTYNIEAFYSQWRPDVLFYTLILSAVLFYAFNRSHLQFKIIERLSKLSFSVFFIHVIILEEVWKGFGLKLFNLTTPNSFGKIIFDPLFFLSVAIISFFVCYIIRKVPLLPKLTG